MMQKGYFANFDIKMSRNFQNWWQAGSGARNKSSKWAEIPNFDV